MTRPPTGTPRLRFDRVALRVTHALQAALRDAVPAGHAALVTITAPIRVPAKTVAALEASIRDGLSRHGARFSLNETMHGNGVRVRIVADAASQASANVRVFVHDARSDPEALLARA
ncbi:MAG TPA: hypothetical protein VFB22_13620 [Candidatus Baltobacteraceae bacterium]|nr:hypothetical protein [Candidatus Baltobacteraceae bacterium]